MTYSIISFLSGYSLFSLWLFFCISFLRFVLRKQQIKVGSLFLSSERTYLCQYAINPTTLMMVLLLISLSETLAMGVDIHSLVAILGMQSLPLFEENEGSTCGNGKYKHHEPYNESQQTVSDDETHNGSTCSTCRPIDIASLESHEFKRFLQSLEHGEVRITFFFICVHNNSFFALSLSF